MKKVTIKSILTVVSLAYTLAYLVYNYDKAWMGYLKTMKLLLK